MSWAGIAVLLEESRNLDLAGEAQIIETHGLFEYGVAAAVSP
jgi:hypothetical protein